MTSASLMNVATRHLLLAAQAHGLTPLETPPFLSLFVRSPDSPAAPTRLDLSLEEIAKLSEELGSIEALHLLGGNAFAREDLAEICAQFARHNRAAKIYVTSDGRHADTIAADCERILASTELSQLNVDLILDGVAPERTIASYDALTHVQTRDARLRMSARSTVTIENLELTERQSGMLYTRCPRLERHSLTLSRGERRNFDARADLRRYLELERTLKSRWADRERGRVRRIVRPALAWTSAQTSEQGTQVVPCKAGVLSAVVYANGDVGVCETVLSHPLLGNLRERSFRELWSSPQAQNARTMIRTRQCACANEVSLAPSVTFQPAHLLHALLRSKVRTQP